MALTTAGPGWLREYDRKSGNQEHAWPASLSGRETVAPEKAPMRLDLFCGRRLRHRHVLFKLYTP
jgi:hypothetical protein